MSWSIAAKVFIRQTAAVDREDRPLRYRRASLGVLHSAELRSACYIPPSFARRATFRRASLGVLHFAELRSACYISPSFARRATSRRDTQALHQTWVTAAASFETVSFASPKSI